jgi:hypothetical protein
MLVTQLLKHQVSPQRILDIVNKTKLQNSLLSTVICSAWYTADRFMGGDISSKPLQFLTQYHTHFPWLTAFFSEQPFCKALMESTATDIHDQQRRKSLQRYSASNNNKKNKKQKTNSVALSPRANYTD